MTEIQNFFQIVLGTYLLGKKDATVFDVYNIVKKNTFLLPPVSPPFLSSSRVHVVRG